MRAVALLLLLALPVSAQEAEKVEVNAAAKLVLEDGRALPVPLGSHVLFPAEVKRLDEERLACKADGARCWAENVSLREQAGQGGVSPYFALGALGLGLLAGLVGGFVLAK